MLSKKIKGLSLVLGLALIFSVCPTTSYASTQSDTNVTNELVETNTRQEILTDKDDIEKYAKDNNLPLTDSDGNSIEKIILNTDKKAEKEIDESVQDDKSLYGVGDVCTINRPYEGYNTDRIAWSTSGTGPATLANTVSRETSSEIFGEFSGKTEVVEAKVGFKIGKKTTCTSSYSVNLASGEYKRIVGYFRYKGYFVDYYTWGGLNHVGTYEVGRPIGIDFIVYSR